MRVDPGISGDEDSRKGVPAVVLLVIHGASLVDGLSAAWTGPAYGFMA
jgi:hypothetical protein